MNSIKIGNVLIKPKGLFFLIFCFFINGISIGFFVASNQITSKSINIFLLIVLLFLPYIILYKSIKKNIVELKDK